MSSYEIITIIISSIALIFSFIALLRNSSIISFKVTKTKKITNNCFDLECILSNLSVTALGINKLQIKHKNKFYPVYIKDNNSKSIVAENLYYMPFQSNTITLHFFIAELDINKPLFLVIHNAGISKKYKIILKEQ